MMLQMMKKVIQIKVTLNAIVIINPQTIVIIMKIIADMTHYMQT